MYSEDLHTVISANNDDDDSIMDDDENDIVHVPVATPLSAQMNRSQGSITSSSSSSIPVVVSRPLTLAPPPTVAAPVVASSSSNARHVNRGGAEANVVIDAAFDALLRKLADAKVIVDVYPSVFRSLIVWCCVV